LFKPKYSELHSSIIPSSLKEVKTY